MHPLLGTRRAGAIGVSGLLVVAMLAAVVTFGTPAATASDLCGETITSNLVLDHDLACSGNGLIVGADGVKIDLNGHTIGGSENPNTVGIRVLGRIGVRMQGPGEVTGFHTGIWIEESENVRVEGLTLFANGAFASSGPPFPFTGLGDGIVVTMSETVRLEGNLVFGNGDDGINVHQSTKVRVVENVVHNNRHDNIRFDLANGNVVSENLVVADSPSPFFPTPTVCNIELFGSKNNRIEENHVVGSIFGIRLNPMGPVASTDNRITENVVESAFPGAVVPGGATIPGRGIHLVGSSTMRNTYEENVIVGNPRGIEFVGGPTANTFKENLLTMNGCGVVGSTASNTFEENEFIGNDADFC